MKPHLITTLIFAATIGAASAQGALRGTTLNLSGNATIGGTTTSTGGFIGPITGNASTAAALQTARNINGVAFNGTADITVTAAAGTLTGTTLNSGVVTSSLTTVGTIGTGIWHGTAIGSAYGGTGVDNSAATGFGKWNSGSYSVESAGTHRASIGGTTAGQAFFTLTNPGAITFPRINADNSVDALDAAAFRTAIGAGSGSVATDGIFDAKGDLPVGTGSDTAARLAVGTDGYILSADSGEATGLKWIAAPSGSVATDTLWDAAGDLAVGTGADTAGKLSMGTALQVLRVNSGATGLEWAAAAGGSPGGSDTHIQFNDSGAFGGVAGLTVNKTTGAVTQLQTTLNSTRVPGLTLQNTTAATNSQNQNSPGIFLEGRGWTTNTSVSKSAGFRMTYVPANGTTVPLGALGWRVSQDGSDAGSDAMSVDTVGKLTVLTGFVTGSGGIVDTGDWKLGTYGTDGIITVETSTGNIGGGINFGGASSSNIGFRASSSEIQLSNGNGTGYKPFRASLVRGATAVETPILRGEFTSGTNQAGVALSIEGGSGTGTGTPGSLTIKTPMIGTSGSTVHTLTTRSYVHPLEKTLTESSATTVLTVALAAGKYAGGEIVVTTHADDGTDFQATTETCVFSAVNKGGTVTATITPTPSSSTTAASAGTLTTAWTIAANGNGFDIKNNAVSSLTQTSLKCTYQLHLNGDGPATVTP